MEVLGGEVVLEVDGFVVTLEPEFTWVLVKVKGLGGAGALREPMDSNSLMLSKHRKYRAVSQLSLPVPFCLVH